MSAAPIGPLTHRLATAVDKPVLLGLYRDYIKVLSRWNDDVGGELEDNWFTDTERLFVAVTEDAAGEVIGFFLVMGRAYAEAMGCDGDHYCHGLHFLEGHRGTGAADSLAEWVFERYHGKWCVEVLKENTRAMGYWKRVLAPHGLTSKDKDDLFVHLECHVPRAARP